jgi:hypothetical protein
MIRTPQNIALKTDLNAALRYGYTYREHRISG